MEEAIKKTLETLPAYQYPNHVIEKVIVTFLSYLPTPDSPYEQAIVYRELVGME